MSDLRDRLDAAVARGSQRVASDAPVTVNADVDWDDATGRDLERAGAPVGDLTQAHVARLHDALERIKKEAELLQVRLAGCDGTSPYALVDQRPAQPELEPLLAVKDVARLIRVSEKTVREWRAKGELPAPINLGGTIRWERAQIRSWLDSRRAVR